MKNIISILENNIKFSPFYFYNEFINKISDFYQIDYNGEKIEFRLVLGSDFEFIDNYYFIDPISLPLFLSLAQQLKDYQKSPIQLFLSNNPGTISILEFLYRADFFHLVGKNINPNYPIGKNIFEFNEGYLGGFQGKNQRIEHKIRCYSLDDDNLREKIKLLPDEESKRDYLVEYFTYKVRDHFAVLLTEKENTAKLANKFIEILAELITNGVWHSESDTYALMFSDKFKTKFSISDNGIGLYKSLEKKEGNSFYKKFDLLNELSSSFNLNVSKHIKLSLLAIFETLYFSMLKDRQGLFDLMCFTVVNCNGYFRLHNEFAQVIVSSRMLNELKLLYKTRVSIINTHNSFLFRQLPKDEFNNSMYKLTLESKKQVIMLAKTIFNKYNKDTRFSAIRLFEVKFRGVHIEVEIPNENLKL